MIAGHVAPVTAPVTAPVRLKMIRSLTMQYIVNSKISVPLYENDDNAYRILVFFSLNRLVTFISYYTGMQNARRFNIPPIHCHIR